MRLGFLSERLLRPAPGVLQQPFPSHTSGKQSQHLSPDLSMEDGASHRSWVPWNNLGRSDTARGGQGFRHTGLSLPFSGGNVRGDSCTGSGSAACHTATCVLPGSPVVPLVGTRPSETRRSAHGCPCGIAQARPRGPVCSGWEQIDRGGSAQWTSPQQHRGNQPPTGTRRG